MRCGALKSGWGMLLAMLAGCSSEPDRNLAAKLIAQQEARSRSIPVVVIVGVPPRATITGALVPMLDEMAAAGFLAKSEFVYTNTRKIVSGGRTLYGCDPATDYPGQRACDDHRYIAWRPTDKLKAQLGKPFNPKTDAQMDIVAFRQQPGEVTGLKKLTDAAYRVEYTQRWVATEAGAYLLKHRHPGVAPYGASSSTPAVAMLERYDNGWRLAKQALY